MRALEAQRKEFEQEREAFAEEIAEKQEIIDGHQQALEKMKQTITVLRDELQNTFDKNEALSERIEKKRAKSKNRKAELQQEAAPVPFSCRHRSNAYCGWHT